MSEYRCRECRGVVQKNFDHVATDNGCEDGACDGTFSHKRTTRHNSKPCDFLVSDLSHGGVVLVL